MYKSVFSSDLWKGITFADQYALREKSPDEKMKIRDAWLRDFLYSQFQLPQVQRTGAVFFRSLVRDDYKGLFHAVIEASGLRDFVVVEDYHRRPHPPRLNLKASRYMLEQADLYDALEIDDPLDRACCFIRACKYGFILDHFRKMQFDALICFADMQPVEHLLARYFRAQGVTTVTLQHGLYVDYGDMDTVNVINYEHQPSEYFLSWGPETSELIGRHHPGNKTVDCGKPLIFTTDPGTDEKNKQPYIAVFLDQQIFNRQNEEMLEIVTAYARQSNRAVRVRFHPSINKKLFLEKFPEIREQLHFTDADFVVGHTSSLIYEALTLGCRVFQFESEIPAIALPDAYRFRTLRELAARQALPQPKGLAQRYFCATGEDSLRRYEQFFRDVLPESIREAQRA